MDSILPEFDECQIKNLGFQAKSGVFGEITAHEIKFSGIKCARKTITGTMADLRAEALVMNSLSGHSCFPYLYGLTNSGAILMEYISGSADRLTHAITLRSILTSGHPKKFWFEICRKLVEGLQFLHGKNILHNDLHSENILIRSCHLPCIIDFGKATLVHAPLYYNLVTGSKEQKTFNTVHAHLAHELRNIPNSPQTELTDIYSLGYNFGSIGKYQKIEEITKLAKKMTDKDTNARYSLIDCSVSLLKHWKKNCLLISLLQIRKGNLYHSSISTKIQMSKRYPFILLCLNMQTSTWVNLNSRGIQVTHLHGSSNTIYGNIQNLLIYDGDFWILLDGSNLAHRFWTNFIELGLL